MPTRPIATTAPEPPILTELNSIDSLRIFEKWTNTSGDHRFGRETIIYGHNGAGKTTLGDVFAALESAQRRHIPATVKVMATFSGATKPRRFDTTTGEAICLYVFNHDYVERNLGGAFRNGEPGTALVQLGEKDIELEKNIADATAASALAEQRLLAADGKLQTAKGALRTFLESIKFAVGSELGTFDPNKYNPNTFNVTKAQGLFAGIRSPVLQADFARARAALRLDAGKPPEPLHFGPCPSTSSLRPAMISLVQHNVTAIAIEALTTNPDLASWVQRGLEFNQADEPCAFCGQSIPSGRLDRLNSHFDTSLRELQSLVAAATSELDGFRQAVNKARAAFDLLAPTIEAVGTLEAAVAQTVLDSNVFAAECQRIISDRYAHPFAPVPSTAPEVPSTSIWVQVQEIVDAHNREARALFKNLQSLQTEACSTILSQIAYEHGHEFDRLVGAQRLAEKSHCELAEEAKATATRLEQLLQARSDDYDGTEIAKSLTEDLAAYLGHAQLAVEFDRSDGKSGYRFQRGGKPATHLSEGERNAIALLYFLRSFEDVACAQDLQRTCVVIDDPVSSLDQNGITAAFNFLQSALRSGPRDCLLPAQVIVLTHNFEFFRLWKDKVRPRLPKRPKDDAPAKQADPIKAAILELQVRCVLGADDAVIRTPRLRSLNQHFESLTSEYYFLFHHACEATLPAGEPYLPLSGNATRRLLEGFLKFKSPFGSNFQNSAKDLGERHQIPAATIMNVTKALNEASHRQELEIHTLQHMETIRANIQAALAFMAFADPNHFVEMVQATNVRPDLGEYASAIRSFKVNGELITPDPTEWDKALA